MKKSLISLAAIGAIGTLSLIQSNRGEIIIKDGDFKGNYVVDTRSKPHTVKFSAPLTSSPSLGIITLYDDDIDGNPDRSLYSIYDSTKNSDDSVIRVDLPETTCHPDEVRMYQEVMKKWGYWEKSIWSAFIYQAL